MGERERRAPENYLHLCRFNLLCVSERDDRTFVTPHKNFRPELIYCARLSNIDSTITSMRHCDRVILTLLSMFYPFYWFCIELMTISNDVNIFRIEINAITCTQKEHRWLSFHFNICVKHSGCSGFQSVLRIHNWCCSQCKLFFKALSFAPLWGCIQMQTKGN